MIVADVFVKGDAHTPERFWSIALRTETKHARFYDSLGYVYCKKRTEEYSRMSKKTKEKVRFNYINGELQKY